MKDGATGVWSRPDPNDFDAALLELTELLHPALAAAGVGAWRYEQDNQCFHFDELLRQLYELPPFGTLDVDQILPKIHQDDREAWHSVMQSASRSDTLRSRHRIVTSDGREHHLVWTGKVADGESNTVVGVCVDVSAEVEVQQELHTEQQRLRGIANGVPGKFGYMDRDYMVQFLSQEYCDWMGVSQQEAIGRHTGEVFGKESMASRRPLFDRAIAGEIVTFEDPGTHNGVPFLDIVTYQPDRDEDGNVCGLFTLRVDITYRRELETNLRKLSEDLSRSNADLEQFAYVASHDLKAPLRAIQVLVEWLQEDLSDYSGGDVQENLQLLSRRSARLNKLLEDLLSYSRVGRNAQPAATVDLGNLVEDIADLLGADNPIDIEVTGEPTNVVADPAAISLVLRNLIGNAVKHHPGPTGKVTVFAEDHADHHVICVADDGSGIPEEFSAKIFQMFQTLKPRDEVEGSGMGLAIVERTVQKQGGKIWFEPAEKGTGTVFKFTWMKNPASNVDK